LEYLKNIIRKNRELVRFLGVAFALLLGWVILTSAFPRLVSDMHYGIIKPQAQISVAVLKGMGYGVESDFGVSGCDARISMHGTSAVCIGDGCSGLELFLIFAGFILAFRGPVRYKLWFMPLGLLAILVLNIIRIISLTLIHYYHPQYLDFNHKYTFVIIVYGAIFGMWMLWVNRYSAVRHSA
jgi:exosortase family protein XrtF